MLRMLLLLLLLQLLLWWGFLLLLLLLLLLRLRLLGLLLGLALLFLLVLCSTTCSNGSGAPHLSLRLPWGELPKRWSQDSCGVLRASICMVLMVPEGNSQ